MTDTSRGPGTSSANTLGDLQRELMVLRQRLSLMEGERNRLIAENAQLRQSLQQSAWGNGGAAWHSPSEQLGVAPDRPRTEPYLPAVPATSAAPTGYAPSIEEMASFDASALKKLKPEELDSLPYGLVVLDREGRILQYNDTESRMAKLPKERVIGRNFFREVAPCTRVREFEGRFVEFAEGRSGSSLETFDFVFRFAHGVQHVAIYLTHGRSRGTFNVAMLRRTR